MAKHHQDTFTLNAGKVAIMMESIQEPAVFWPDDFRRRFKELQDAGLSSLSARHWYRWRVGWMPWLHLLWFPEDSIAIVEHGPSGGYLPWVFTGGDAGSPAIAVSSALAVGALSTNP